MLLRGWQVRIPDSRYDCIEGGNMAVEDAIGSFPFRTPRQIAKLRRLTESFVSDMFLANQIELIAPSAALTANASRWQKRQAHGPDGYIIQANSKRWRRTVQEYLQHLLAYTFLHFIPQDHNSASKLATRKPCNLIDIWTRHLTEPT